VRFKTRDMNDFEAKVKYAIENVQILKSQLESINMVDNADAVINVYNELLGEKNVIER
jgi:hypothetical protein